jgi:dephospho-CoA kinase
MLRVGLTGPTGAGKSTVSGMLRARGIPVIDADRSAHALYVPGSPLVDGLVRAFGEGILDGEGGVDRRKLGAVVFADEAKLAKLGEIVHPRLLENLERDLDALEEGGEPVAVVEAALLLQWGPPLFIDVVVGVVAERNTRRNRLLASGLPPERVDARLDAQTDGAAVRAGADRVVVNEGDLDALESAVDALVREWVGPRNTHGGGNRRSRGG